MVRRLCVISCGGLIRAPLARCFTRSAVRKLRWLSNPENAEKQRNWIKGRPRPDFKTVDGRLKANMRTRVYLALKGKVKVGKTAVLLGCDTSQLRAHLESKFKPGMSWDNYGQWHVDHIKPCVKFDLSDPAQQRACFHYTNLQPLWASENLSKSGSYLGS